MICPTVERKAAGESPPPSKVLTGLTSPGASVRTGGRSLFHCIAGRVGKGNVKREVTHDWRNRYRCNRGPAAATLAEQAHVELPGAPGTAGHLARGDHVPGGQARPAAGRWRQGQHPLPRLAAADGAGRRPHPAGRRHCPGDPPVPQHGAGLPPPGAARPARRLLPAARRPRHRRHRHPRDGLGRR